MIYITESVWPKLSYNEFAGIATLEHPYYPKDLQLLRDIREKYGVKAFPNDIA